MSQTHAEPARREAAEDQSLGELVSLVSRDVSHLVRAEIDLAKVEITADLKRGGVGGGLLGGAGFFGYVALLFLSAAAAFALAIVLPLWAGFAIIGGIYLLLATLLGLVGLSNFKKLNKIQRTKRTVQDTIAWAKRGFKREEQAQPQG